MAARYSITWGDLTLDCLLTTEARGRSLVELVPVSGTGGLVLDAGPEPRKAQLTICWVARSDTDDPLARRDEFLAAVAEGVSRLFVHPLEGAVYQAKVGSYTERTDASSVVVDEVELVEDRETEFEPELPGAGVEPAAGAESVAVAADNVNAALAALALESEEPEAARALAADWRDRSTETNTVVDSRRIDADLTARLTAMATEIERLGLASSNARYGAYLGFVQLASALRQAAASATQKTSYTTTVTIATPTSLLAFCASVDPARAQDLYDGARALNRIDTPLRLEAGTALRFPVL
jgi:hypothetical protein